MSSQPPQPFSWQYGPDKRRLHTARSFSGASSRGRSEMIISRKMILSNTLNICTVKVISNLSIIYIYIIYPNQTSNDIPALDIFQSQCLHGASGVEKLHLWLRSSPAMGHGRRSQSCGLLRTWPSRPFRNQHPYIIKIKSSATIWQRVISIAVAPSHVLNWLWHAVALHKLFFNTALRLLRRSLTSATCAPSSKVTQSKFGRDSL